MSGIPVDQGAIDAYNAFKLQNSKKDKKFAFIIFRIIKENVVEVYKLPKSGDNKADWDTFTQALATVGYPAEEKGDPAIQENEKDMEPSYAVFDFETTKNDVIVQKILFISFVPDVLSPKKKMPYGSTKENVKNAFGSGIHKFIHATDMSMLDYGEVVKAL